ncbi:MAG: HIT domain-containing protein [Phycisphaerales bacterium]|nr:HIT domain-containing protein [Phycisphaerales bacterium]
MSDFQQNLWAPWRMEYIDSLGTTDEACFLCAAERSPEQDAANYVLWRGPSTIVLLNRFPYSSGHLLIAPREHRAAPEDLSDATLLELMQQARNLKQALAAALNAQGFNLGMNLGHCAGAGLPGHLHLHIVPRWAGDVNFMAVLADVKVIPQSLAKVRELILASADALRLGLRTPP